MLSWEQPQRGEVPVVVVICQTANGGRRGRRRKQKGVCRRRFRHVTTQTGLLQYVLASSPTSRLRGQAG